MKTKPTKKAAPDESEVNAELPWPHVHNKALVLSFLLYYLNNGRRCRYTTHVNTNDWVHNVLVAYDLAKQTRPNSNYEDEEDWQLTEKGKLFVAHLLGQPLPEQKVTWVMPGQKD